MFLQVAHVTQDWGWLASIQHETLGTWTIFILSVCQLQTTLDTQ